MCVYIYRQRLEFEFASQANFMLKPHMMLCPDGMQREEKNFRFHLHFHFSVYVKCFAFFKQRSRKHKDFLFFLRDSVKQGRCGWNDLETSSRNPLLQSVEVLKRQFNCCKVKHTIKNEILKNFSLAYH